MEEQKQSSLWLASNNPAMMQFIKQWHVARGNLDKARCAERTLTSYVLQAAEGVSRQAKLWWCKTGQGDTTQLASSTMGLLLSSCS